MGLLARFGALAAVAAAFALPVPAAIGADTTTDRMLPSQATAYTLSIQTELAAHGYDPGPADGTLGPQTGRAIMEYQRDAGLPVDGLPSKELLDHLYFALPKVYKGQQPAGAGGVVLDVQRELAARGYPVGVIDGVVGPRTRAAARRFRRDAGLADTGMIDAGLLQALRSAGPDVRAN